MKITAAVVTYNELARIEGFLAHALQWADEVVVFDKTSTDGTAEIAARLGAKVVVIPYTPAGHGDPGDLLPHCRNDWIWLFTAGEVPTRNLVRVVHELLDERGDQQAVIYLPKKLYSFGLHDDRSPWSVSYQGFLFHRYRATIRDCIHANISGPGLAIKYSDEHFVLHPTHPNVRAFMSQHVDYIHKEALDAADPLVRIESARAAIRGYDFGSPLPEDELFGQLCAWRFYHYGVMLACWEKARGRTSDSAYAEMRERMLDREWR